MLLTRLKHSSRALGMVMAVGLLTTLPACKRVMNDQGYIIDEELLAAVQPGVDNKQSVTKMLGRPTLTSKWEDTDWYYVSRTTKQFAFHRPDPVKQTLLIVRFTPDGTVQSVEKEGLELAADITPNPDKTRTLGRESGLLQDLFGNIGQVGAGGMGGGQ